MNEPRQISEYFNKYLNLRDILYEIRMKNDNYYSENEEPIIEQMDNIWSNLTDHERNVIKKQGSWKFK
jgi:hypothetical protein